MDELRIVREKAEQIKNLAKEISNYETYGQIIEDYSRRLKNKKIDKKTYKKLLKGRKKEDLEIKGRYKKKDELGYKDLERQVRELGNIFEKEKQGKTGLFGNIFRKK